MRTRYFVGYCCDYNGERMILRAIILSLKNMTNLVQMEQILQIIFSCGAASSTPLLFPLTTCLTLTLVSKSVFIALKSHLERRVLFWKSPTLYSPRCMCIKQADGDIVIPRSVYYLRFHVGIPGLDTLDCVTHLELPHYSSPCGVLPPNLTHLKVDCTSLLPEPLSVHCPKLKQLIFTQRSIPNLHNLPLSLLSLTVHSVQAQDLRKLPQSLKFLNIRCPCKSISAGLLPRGLTYLLLGGDFNLPVDNLPPNLIYLFLSDVFSQPIDHLPTSLQVLRLGDTFNHPIHHLPPNLVKLSLGDGYSNSADHLPKLLTHLFFGSNFCDSVDFLPTTITHLQFGAKFNCSVDHLPPTLLHLVLGDKFDQRVDHLPQTLVTLRFGACFNGYVDWLPSRLVSLSLGFKFDKPVDHLPPTLRILRLSSCFNKSIDNLPPNLEELVVGEHFRQSIDHLPANLRKLGLKCLTEPSIHYLPPKIAVVYFFGLSLPLLF